MRHSPFRFIPDIFIKRRPIHFTYFVTRRCNARCDFCFYVDGDAPRGDELSIAEIDRVTSSMGKLLWLALSGGEIFLRQDLPEIVRAFYVHNEPSIILLPTNGLMPAHIASTTEAILRQCPRSTVVVKLSLDGVGEAHDRMRGVPGAFEKMRETYGLLAPLMKSYEHFELGINTVFCADNQDMMSEIIRYASTLPGLRTHTVSLVRGEGQRTADMDKYLKTAEALACGRQPTYNFRGAGIKAAQDIVQRRLIHRTVTRGARQLPCYAGQLNLVMSDAGDVYACESFRAEHMLGNVRRSGYDIRAITSSAGARAKIGAIRRSCFCSHECFMMTNILFNPARLAEVAAARITCRA